MGRRELRRVLVTGLPRTRFSLPAQPPAGARYAHTAPSILTTSQHGSFPRMPAARLRAIFFCLAGQLSCRSTVGTTTASGQPADAGANAGFVARGFSSSRAGCARGSSSADWTNSPCAMGTSTTRAHTISVRDPATGRAQFGFDHQMVLVTVTVSSRNHTNGAAHVASTIRWHGAALSITIRRPQRQQQRAHPASKCHPPQGGSLRRIAGGVNRRCERAQYGQLVKINQCRCQTFLRRRR